MKKVFVISFFLFRIAGAQTVSPTPSTQNPEAVLKETTIQSNAAPSQLTQAHQGVPAVPSVTESVSISPVELPIKKQDSEREAFHFFGDFRYRHQTETQGSKDARTLQRLQARFGVSNQLHDNLKVTLRLMTGSSANSGNQTLGDEKAPGMPRRSFGLDQAFFEYNPSSSWIIYGGKMPQFFTFVGKNQMILDADIAPEGLGVKFSQAFEQSLEFFVQGGTFWIRENYDSQFGEDATDNFLNAAQLGLQWKPEDWTVTFGLGSFAYVDLKDTPPANITSGATGNGNTLDIAGNYPTNFDIDEMFIEAKTKIEKMELAIFAEFLTNKDANDLNKAKAFGVQAKYGHWNFGYLNKEVEKDAVVGVFTDSDFGGGSTSVKGSVWNLGYKLSKKVQIQYTLFKNQTAIDLAATDYDRSHLDLQMSF